MEVIRGPDGKVVSQSQNLRGIRRYIGCHTVSKLDVSQIGDGTEGQLSILFENGNSFQTEFGAWSVLKHFVRHWRNVYGTPLSVNGKDCGKVQYKNPALM